MSPQYWALATFLIPFVDAVAYVAWLIIATSHLATSTQSEELVRTGIYVGIATAFAFVQRPWARALAVASTVTLALWLVGVFEFEVLRHP
jgi:hypothetical protein